MARAKKEVEQENVVAETVETNEAAVQQETKVEVKTETKQEVKSVIVEETDIKAGEVVGTDMPTERCDTDKVVVCLNYPQNIIFNVKHGEPDEHDVEFYGNASYLVGKEMGVLPLGAYGLTPNVAKEDWEWICKNYKDSKLIQRGLLFAEVGNKARDAARERKNLRNGSEPVVKEVDNKAEV